MIRGVYKCVIDNCTELIEIDQHLHVRRHALENSERD